jgi:hypothetical protein
MLKNWTFRRLILNIDSKHRFNSVIDKCNQYDKIVHLWKLILFRTTIHLFQIQSMEYYRENYQKRKYTHLHVRNAIRSVYMRSILCYFELYVIFLKWKSKISLYLSSFIITIQISVIPLHDLQTVSCHDKIYPFERYFWYDLDK